MPTNHDTEDTVAAGLDSALDSIPAQLGHPGMADEAPGFTAMVVDDHPLVRESMVARLKMMGAREVVEAATIGEARARANLSGPRELCVLDLGLPDGSGLELLTELRATYPHRPFHAIALSGYGMEEDMRKSREAGFVEHVIKPVNVSQLSAVIRRVVETNA